MTTEEKILQIISENVERNSEIKMGNSIKESGIDSLGVMMIVDALEDELDIELETEEIADIETIGDIVKYIKNKVESK